MFLIADGAQSFSQLVHRHALKKLKNFLSIVLDVDLLKTINMLTLIDDVPDTFWFVTFTRCLSSRRLGSLT